MGLTGTVTPAAVRRRMEQALSLIVCRRLHGPNGHACDQCTRYGIALAPFVASTIKATALAAIGPRTVKGSEYQPMGRGVEKLEALVGKAQRES